MNLDHSTALELANRLAGESVLAVAGRDEGLIPAYSLLGELADCCAEEDRLLRAVREIRSQVERLIDAVAPFDEATLGNLRRFVEWFTDSVDRLTSGAEWAPWASTGAPETKQAKGPAGRSASAGEEEVLLKIDIENSGELLKEFYGEAAEHLQSIEAALLVLEQQPGDPEALNSIFRSFHTIKGNAGFLGLVPMHRLAHEVETLLDLVRTDKLKVSAGIVTEILRSRDALVSLNQQVSAAIERGRLPDQIIPIAALIAAVRDLAAGKEQPAVGSPLPVVAPSAPPETPKGPSSQASKQTVRVSTEKLDALMDVVGELVIVQSQLNETARSFGGVVPPLSGNVALLSRITKELQFNAMSLRMVPVQPTFQKMERLARDLARDCGKKAVFTTSGGDTELDRTMVEEIADPLVHMVRNALDHGLEKAEDRIASGKPETGNVSLRAYHQGGKVLIELRDDGRGLNPEKLLAKARQKGLISADAQLSADEVLKLIFLPGFSTAEKVTAVSGRGVGMDVVRRNIERLRGEIDISSEVGKGTVFTIKLPLTMAIIDGLVVRVGEHRFILPSTSVLRAVRPAAENVVTVNGCGEVLDLRGRLFPLHRLDRLYGLAPSSASNIAVIVESSGKTCALFVDEMVGKQEVVIKNLGSYLQGQRGVSGAAILGDGAIALILDPGALLQAA